MLANTTIKDFKINDFLTLKFEGGRTVIYVKNRPFRQCMYLLLDISVDRVEKYDEIRMIAATIRYTRSFGPTLFLNISVPSV